LNRILVVEDEPDARRLISTVLFQAHAQVTAVANVREALAELRTRNGEFDLILSDIGMPGEDGCDLLTQIRQSEHDAATPRRHILAAALSAMTRDSDRARALACGFDAFFAKPIDPAELITGLSQLLGSPAALQRRGPLS
jgi:CheY-like chemotaxis protein